MTCGCFLGKNDVKSPVPTDSLPAPAPIEKAFERVLIHNANTITPFSGIVKFFSTKKERANKKKG